MVLGDDRDVAQMAADMNHAGILPPASGDLDSLWAQDGREAGERMQVCLSVGGKSVQPCVSAHRLIVLTHHSDTRLPVKMRSFSGAAKIREWVEASLRTA
jgi:hypothetical protein